jgi:predicted DCC family thiol-disulfide oxidoreductase YuxK
MPALASPAPTTTKPPGPVVLYDGVCGLCDRYVQFILRRDRRGHFWFAPLQGRFAAQSLERHGITPGPDPESIVLLESVGTPSERARVRSDAVLAILTGLGGPWRLAGLLRVIPRRLRDAVYNLVARFRTRIFGRLESCSVPPPSAATRFLE